MISNFAPVENLLFDLGGVLLALSEKRQDSAFLDLFTSPFSNIHRNHSELYEEFERGRVALPDFRRAVAEALSPGEERKVSDADFDRAFGSIIGPFLEPNVETLVAQRKRRRVFLLSNTNAIHARQFEASFSRQFRGRFESFPSLFEVPYYSHDLDSRKPDAECFERVLTTSSLRAETTLFIDDNHDNIESARRLGFQVHLHPKNSLFSEELLARLAP